MQYNGKLCVDCGQPVDRVRDTASGRLTQITLWENGAWVICLECGALMVADSTRNTGLRAPKARDFNRAAPETRQRICHWQGQAMAAIVIRGRVTGVV